MSRVELPDLPAEVIERALDGDQAAFVEFYERYDPTVRWAVGLRIHRWPELVPELEDIVQDVWFALMKNACKRLRYHDPARGVPFWRFVVVVAMRLAWRLGKKRLEHVEVERVDVLDDHESFEARLLDADFLDRVCAKAKARLNAKDWALLEGYYVRGEQLKDIGAGLGLSENATYKRKERLNKKLEELAQELTGDAHPTGPGELVAIAIAVMVVAGHAGNPVIPGEGSTEVDHA